MNWVHNLLLPKAHGPLSQPIDDLFVFLVWLSIFFFVLICGILFYAVVKYRRKGPDDVTPHISHNLTLEVTWTVIPLIIVIAIFFWGFHDYLEVFTTPADALEIRVTGKKWAWQFEYPDGTISLGEFHVPVGRPVKLLMSSEDVLHNFSLKDFRTKHDVVPGRYTEMWFQADETTDATKAADSPGGPHMIQCAAYCGTSHSAMWGKLHVDSVEKFDEWLQTGGLGKDAPPEKIGKLTYENAGCNTCHSLDGSKMTGPTWKGLYGSSHGIEEGGNVTVDENYIRESILNPNAKTVKGYPRGQMPTYQGVLKDRQIDGLIAYMKTLK